MVLDSSAQPRDPQQQFEFVRTLASPREIFLSADETLLKALREDRRIERKPAGIHPKELGTYFSMWANTPDGGLLVVGMEDDGTIQGLSSLNPKQLNNIEKSGMVYCPDAALKSKRLPAVNKDGQSDFILLFFIDYRMDKVVETVDGNAYIRVGDSRHKLSHDEVHELQIDKGQVDLEQEPSKIPYPNGFDMEAIRSFCETIQRVSKMEQAHSVEEVLAFRHLGTLAKGKFVPNVACALIFARDPLSEFPGCKIRFMRYDGEWEGTGTTYNVVKDNLIEGNIPTLLVDAEEILDSQLREFSRLGKDGKFYTTSEYPKEAWYEAVVNACVHRSYGLRNMNIFIKMFDDRLVIESPGGFPPFVTPDNIYESHHPRNPHLMNALHYLDFVKCANEGTRRMRDTMEK